ncbi:MAG: hypothetical protein ABIJ45_13370, partial [Candidatus Zixiibacteriota bacterium]
DMKKVDLFNMNHSLSYDFEATGRKYSDISTNISSGLIKSVNLSANLTHSLYSGESDIITWKTLHLTNFTFSANTSLRPKGSLGDYQYADSAGGGDSKKQALNFGISHQFRETNQNGKISKTHSVNINLNIDLTPNTNIKYTQYYRFDLGRTISRSLDIVRKMHCWEGQFHWVIDGSNKGFYFKINVMAIPDIKYEKDKSNVRNIFGGN